MLYTGGNEKIEGYTGYRNRTMTRHLEKMKNTLMQIRQCSLKEEDKVKLRKQLIELINETKEK